MQHVASIVDATVDPRKGEQPLVVPKEKPAPAPAADHSESAKTKESEPESTADRGAKEDEEGEGESDKAHDENTSIYVVVYLRKSNASKNGLKPEVIDASAPEPDRVIMPPEGCGEGTPEVADIPLQGSSSG